METHRRSIAKTISWRIISTCLIASIVWITTGKLSVAVMIGLVDVFTKSGIYYLHERCWTKIKYGVVNPPEYEI